MPGGVRWARSFLATLDVLPGRRRAFQWGRAWPCIVCIAGPSTMAPVFTPFGTQFGVSSAGTTQVFILVLCTFSV